MQLHHVRPYRQIVVRGRAPETILESVSRFDGNLLVIGASRKSAGEARAGATTEEILRSASVPVLVVPHRGAPAPEG